MTTSVAGGDDRDSVAGGDGPDSVAGGDGPDSVAGGDDPEFLMSPDEHVRVLTELLAGSTDHSDHAGLVGMLGCAHVEIYERDGNEEAFLHGVARLTEALELAPGHDDREQWLFTLGVGYYCHAEAGGGVDGFDRAIEWLTRLRAEQSAVSAARDETTALLLDARWNRYWGLRYGRGCDGDGALVEVERLITALAAAPVNGAGPDLLAYRDAMVGRARVERYELTDERSDLDEAVALLAGSVPGLQADLPLIGFLTAGMAAAYWLRAVRDDDYASLDLAIDTGARARDLIGDDDQLSALMLAETLALAHGVRWHATAQRADLDQAIESWRALVAASSSTGSDVDGGDAANLGELLRERGELTADLTELAEAIGLLERATRLPPGDPDAWQRWLELAQAHRAQWSVAARPGSLEAASECLDRAVRARPPDADGLLQLHLARVSTGYAVFGRDVHEPHDGPPASASWFRDVLRDGCAALDQADAGDSDVRATLALMLGLGQMWVTGHDLGDVDLPQVGRLLDTAERMADPPEDWQAFLDLGRGLWRYATDASNPSAGTDHGVADLARTLRSGLAEVDTEVADAARGALAMAAHARGAASGDIQGLRSARATIRVDAGDRDASGEAEVLDTIFAALDRGRVGDMAGFAALGQRLSDQVAARPAIARDEALAPMINLVRQLAGVVAGAPVQQLPAVTPPAAGESDFERLGQWVGAMSNLADGIRRNDIDLLRANAQHIDSIVDGFAGAPVLRLGMVVCAGMAHLEVARRDRADRVSARRADELLAEAVTLAGGEGRAAWPIVALASAEASRLAGFRDPAATRALGLSALAGHARQVLLQTSTEHAVEAAGTAASDAATVAGWCLDDGSYDDLLAALDAGRALALAAATMSRGVADRLADIGHGELAGQWRETAGLGRDQLTGGVLTDDSGISDDLRGQTLDALGGGLLEPITAEEVQVGLAAAAADAIVYLVPAAHGRPGAAVIVPVSGSVDVIRLPRLEAGPTSPVGKFAGARGPVRDAGPVSPAPGLPLAARIDELCRWAWTAGIDNLVGYAQRWRRRPAHIVLVPMGPLALVPWHAAYRHAGTGRRYAMQDAVFSYAPSARMFCEATRRPVRPIRSALVVGNPGGDLPFAGLEARALHQTFYPSGTYLGQWSSGRSNSERSNSVRSNSERSTDVVHGRGTPQEVLDWIKAMAPGPSMLHLACHGQMDTARPAEAHLVLAGANLSARDLLDASRLAALVIDQVFLAACTTNTSGEDYDEAFSLASAFLAAGASTVFGSLWPVPDQDTSLLMFMVHHHLNVDGLAPAEALHRAQLWMLDLDRRPPAGMPEELAASCDRSGAADPVAWAGFTHIGR